MKIVWLVLLTFALTACGGQGRMMSRHYTALPADYANLVNPVSADAASLAQGAAVYAESCAVCHGAEGWGDGPAAENMEPPPAALAHTSHMLSDAYLYYRISEGGQSDPFNSAMPSFKQALDETDRWNVIHYIRSLETNGAGGGMMGRGNQGRMMGHDGFVWWTAGIGLLLLLFIFWLVRRRSQKSAEPVS